MNEINILRAFMPQTVVFGTDPEMINGQWLQQGSTHTTWFKSDDLYVQVMFVRNAEWGCAELLFKTALRDISQPVDPRGLFFSLLRDPRLPEDANRATRIFRQVINVALTRIGQFDRIGFNGEHAKLDRIYSRLGRLRYVDDLAKVYGFELEKHGRDIFLNRTGHSQQA